MNADPLAPVTQDRDRWQAMADQADCLLWITDIHGQLTGFNAAWLRWRGRDPQREVGTGWLDGVHPDDLQLWQTIFKRHFERRQPFATQFRLRRADGEYGLMSVSARPWHEVDGTFGGFVGRCELEAPLTASDSGPTEDLYRTTIEALQEGVTVSDAQGRFITVNEAAAVFLGKDRDALIGLDTGLCTSHLDVIDEHGVAVPADQHPTITARRTRRPVSGSILGWHTDGLDLRWFSVNSRPLLTPEGDLTAVVTSFMDVTAQKHAADNARHEARHDALTGLVNRWGLRDVVRGVLERTPRRGEQVALLYCDLDNFKEVNDTFGHAAGDELLSEVAHRIRSCVRSGDVVARIGGDEVVAVLDAVTDLDGALVAAQKVLAAVARPCTLGTAVVVPQLSIGVAMLPSFGEFDETLNRADEAMYAAKAAGRNRVMTLD